MTKRDRQKDKQTLYQHNIWIKSSSFFSIRVNKLYWRMQIFTTFSGMRPVKDTLLLQRLFEFFWRRTQFKMHLKKAIWFFGFDEFSNVLLIWLFQIGGWEEFSRKYPKISPPSYIWFWNWPFARMQTGPTKSSCPQNQLQLREIHWNILHSMPKTT